jgi:hypothetical protein
MLDPKRLSPEQLYRLISEAWAQGEEFERERIIKLLEDNILTFYQISEDKHASMYPVDHIIALIKEQQN